MKIWQRYIFRQLFYAFLFFLFCILALYTAIDFSLNGVRFLSKESASYFSIALHYLRHFSKFTPLFFSLSFLLATLKVLVEMGGRREIVALQSAGISSKQILAPFFTLAALLAAFSYVNFEWIAPEANRQGDYVYNADSKPKNGVEKVFSLVLEDGSELIYQRYDEKKQTLCDVFWILSFNDFWHMKTVAVNTYPPEANFVDHFVRSETGALERADSLTKRAFPELCLNAKASFQEFIPFENRSLSTLFSGAIGRSADRPRSAAHLHYKLAHPLFPFLMIISLTPFALRFQRTRSSLLFISSSLFVFVALLTFLDAMLILGENQAILPQIAIWGPFGAGCLIAAGIWKLRSF